VSRSSISRGQRYTRFVGIAAAIVLVMIAIGFVPTRRLAGEQATGAMVAGCAISFISAAFAGWLLVAVDAETPTARLQRASLAMAVRLAVVVVLGVAAALSGIFAPRPLLLWLAMTYMVLLPLEVRLAIAPQE
jgi:hypothetical protein